MGEYFDKVPARAQEHVKSLVKSAGLEDTEESLELLSKGWLEKQEIFSAKIGENDMEEVDNVDVSESKGALVMTYSGSLLTIGAEAEGARSAEYASIGLRQDVPESAKSDDAELDGDIEVDGVVQFKKGPIKKSSPVFAIAVVKEELEPEEEDELLSEVTQILTQEFVDVNKTMIAE